MAEEQTDGQKIKFDKINEVASKHIHRYVNEFTKLCETNEKASIAVDDFITYLETHCSPQMKTQGHVRPSRKEAIDMLVSVLVLRPMIKELLPESENTPIGMVINATLIRILIAKKEIEG